MSTPAPSTSRGLAAISSLSDTEKVRLFDHLQSTHANLASSQPPANASSDIKVEELDHTVYFANAYSALARSSTKNDDLVSDTGADRFIFHSFEQFMNL